MNANWLSPQAVKAQYRNAIIYRNNRVVFNIGGRPYYSCMESRSDSPADPFGITLPRDIPLTYPIIKHKFHAYHLNILLWAITMERASVFKSNKSQAVRLPKPVALPESVKKVDIVPLGRSRLINVSR